MRDGNANFNPWSLEVINRVLWGELQRCSGQIYQTISIFCHVW